jgi:hypothetical protein
MNTSRLIQINETYMDFVYCACGCGKTRSKYQIENGRVRKDRPKLFILGHHLIGIPRTEHTKEKIKKSTKGKFIGERSPSWKGDSVGINGLHRWIRRNLPRPEKCHMCNQKPPRDLANITGLYNREFKNWAYFCRRCHLLFDNIIERNLRIKHKEYFVQKNINKKEK